MTTKDELDLELDLIDGAGCIEAATRVLGPEESRLPVVVARADGVWVTDVDGVRYLDCAGARGSVLFGHRHPRLVAAASRQLDKVTLAGPDVHAEVVGPFARDLARLAGKDRVVLALTGAEAVAAAVRSSVRWALGARGVPAQAAGVVIVAGSAHAASAAGAAGTAA
ncbi:MAG TPA: aminotransferase class III-fold pyridoxal phosphate-dependent enzyme, partial [Candidatus Lustribacter sp.]|nr:aminotransferase class III-fold pyridoxal phosphate-dependent enzyme [Candidatus Lustribacter sp.]